MGPRCSLAVRLKQAELRDEHLARARRWEERVDRCEQHSRRLSFGRLGVFLLAVVGVAAAVQGGPTTSWSWWLAGVGTGVFFVLVFWHALVSRRSEKSAARAAVHRRHAARVDLNWEALPWRPPPQDVEAPAYAHDLDLSGPESLFHRIDVTHTRQGARTLMRWLSAATDPDTRVARQEARSELSAAWELRQEMEASAEAAYGYARLDGAPLLEALRLPARIVSRPWLARALLLAPVILLGGTAAWALGWLPFAAVAMWGVVQLSLLFFVQSHAVRALDLIAAKRGYAEAVRAMLVAIEGAVFHAPMLRELQARLRIGGTQPSHYLKRIDRIASLGELRHQGPFHFILNVSLLWDAHVLWALERLGDDLRSGFGDALVALGELEALASFATLAAVDPAARDPERLDQAAKAVEPLLLAEKVEHPLLGADERVGNDLRLDGRGHLLIVTGSNMAGKSTFLRAVGLNAVLAMAGAPVCAKRFAVSQARLCTSMRTIDSLQKGASYFYAELERIEALLAAVDESLPVIFLLDELLRGTNAEAREVGARALLRYLLDRGATGVVATHDRSLTALAEELPQQISNAHMTETTVDGEMRFDYRLRPGPAEGGNALALLRRIGLPLNDSLVPPPEESRA